jgi:hypothetical protein
MLFWAFLDRASLESARTVIPGKVKRLHRMPVIFGQPW